MPKLKPCKSCGHQVAPNAPTCPNCGAKNPGGGITAYRIAQILVVLVGGLIVAALVISPYSSKSEFDRQMDKLRDSNR
jgi:hypothetical protein